MLSPRSHSIRIGVVLLWSLLLLGVASSSLPLGTLTPPLFLAQWSRVLLPQGWGFFTRDAEEPVLRVHSRDGDRWQCIDRPLASPTNWFGLCRDGRIRELEVARILHGVPETAWEPCRDPVDRCWPVTRPPARVVVNEARRPLVEGDLLLQMQERLPWAWGGARDRVDMPSRVVRVQVVRGDDDAG